jgi:hypothetical protein
MTGQEEKLTHCLESYQYNTYTEAKGEVATNRQDNTTLNQGKERRCDLHCLLDQGLTPSLSYPGSDADLALT